MAGSSPRGRGTARRIQRTRRHPRFIPAWAGNRHGRGLQRLAPAVHPRVGGEQWLQPAHQPSHPGSSPRGRGTGRRWQDARSGRRFIPAWAGNSRERMSYFFLYPVHPRVGGEQRRRELRLRTLGGSSPRGRGTGHAASSCACVQRFIPAWAGNRYQANPALDVHAVHPRVGGEQRLSLDMPEGNSGSSPRGRGTVYAHPDHGKEARFIPAWAGNRIAKTIVFAQPEVHPRVGGEQEMAPHPSMSKDGSSPRGRGTAARTIDDEGGNRFIPAWAGNSWINKESPEIEPVHPRVGGEQTREMAHPPGTTGSSPRGRGTARVKKTAKALGRFIPAWAGNSRC